jgi:hypothetical protein
MKFSRCRLHSGGSEAAFVKYGPLLAMGEASTQDYIADHVNSDMYKDFVVLVPRIYYAFRYEGIGYITMQYVDGNDCNQNDLDAIALAVNRPRSIPSPTVSPGPVGGVVAHLFFVGHWSSVQYGSVEDLQEHVNKVNGAFYSLYRLFTQVKLDSHLGKLLVSSQCRLLPFYEEDGGTLRLCLDDIHQGNFRKDTSGRLFALDFAKSRRKPTSFLSLFRISHSWMATILPKK